MEDQDPTESLPLGPQAESRRLTPGLLHSSTGRPQNRENKASMSMKTKDKYKKSLSRTVPHQAPAPRPRAAGRKVS